MSRALSGPAQLTLAPAQPEHQLALRGTAHERPQKRPANRVEGEQAAVLEK
jgi:hypothetical protein